MPRLNIERQNKLEPDRLSYAKTEIEKLGYKVTETNKNLTFEFKGHKIIFWPYSGWASGKTIKDGRGLRNLLRQIR